MARSNGSLQSCGLPRFLCRETRDWSVPSHFGYQQGCAHSVNYCEVAAPPVFVVRSCFTTVHLATLVPAARKVKLQGQFYVEFLLKKEELKFVAGRWSLHLLGVSKKLPSHPNTDPRTQRLHCIALFLLCDNGLNTSAPIFLLAGCRS